MTCPRCRSAMKEQKRCFHKQRKWVCPRCGNVRMQSAFERQSRAGHPKYQRFRS
jgi:transposase-like protein